MNRIIIEEFVRLRDEIGAELAIAEILDSVHSAIGPTDDALASYKVADLRDYFREINQ